MSNNHPFPILRPLVADIKACPPPGVEFEKCVLQQEYTACLLDRYSQCVQNFVDREGLNGLDRLPLEALGRPFGGRNEVRTAKHPEAYRQPGRAVGSGTQTDSRSGATRGNLGIHYIPGAIRQIAAMRRA